MSENGEEGVSFVGAPLYGQRVVVAADCALSNLVQQRGGLDYALLLAEQMAERNRVPLSDGIHKLPLGDSALARLTIEGTFPFQLPYADLENLPVLREATILQHGQPAP